MAALDFDSSRRSTAGAGDSHRGRARGGLGISFTYWVANHNNRSPTLIDGVWGVEGGGAFDSGEAVDVDLVDYH